MLAKAALLRAGLLTTVAVVAFAVTAACGGGGKDDVTTVEKLATVGPSVEVTTTGGLQTIERSGNLVLATPVASHGGEVVVRGTGWNGTGSVSFYLVTAEQNDAGISLLQLPLETVGLDSIEPKDGAVTLTFRLQDHYRQENGDELRIEPGQQLFVYGTQDNKQGRGGSSTGALTVGR